MIQYYNNLVPEFSGRLMPVGSTFSIEGVSFGVSRPGNEEHPINRLLSLTVANVVSNQAWIDAARLKWFGPDPNVADSDAGAAIAALEAVAVKQVLWAAVQVILVISGAWMGLCAISIAHNLGRHTVRNEVCATVREALGLKAEEVKLRDLFASYRNHPPQPMQSRHRCVELSRLPAYAAVTWENLRDCNSLQKCRFHVEK